MQWLLVVLAGWAAVGVVLAAVVALLLGRVRRRLVWDDSLPDVGPSDAELAGSGLAGPGLAGSGVAGSGVAGSGLAGSGVAGPGLGDLEPARAVAVDHDAQQATA